MLITEESRARRAAYIRAWKKENPDKVNAINLRVKAKNPELYRAINRRSAAAMRRVPGHPASHQEYRRRNPERYLMNHVKTRAKAKGIPFDLTIEDIVIPEFCPVLGIRLEWGIGQRASANRASPSVDRLIPELGYVKGNIRVISNRANHLKNNGTLAELEAIVAYMKRELGS